MRVIATEGLKVPTEANPREYITPESADANGPGVEIEPTAYYIRRLADKELVEVDGVQPNPTGPAAAKGAAAKGKSSD